MFNKYILILIWIGIMAVLQPRFFRKQYNKLTNEYDWLVGAGFAFIVMLPVIWIAGTRGWIMDTSAYILKYRSMPSTLSAIPKYLSSQTKDFGFYFVSCLLKVLLGSNYVPYLTVLAFFQSIAIIKLYRKYSVNYMLSIFLFIASATYTWMLNGLRQFTAACLILLATPAVLKKKYVRTIILVLLASTLHGSALIMIPIIFIAQGKAWNKKTILLIIATIIAIVFVDKFTNILSYIAEDTQYQYVFESDEFWNDDGANPLLVLVECIPAIIAFCGRRVIEKYDAPIINFCVNTSIITGSLYIVSMITSGIFIGRLPIYCSMYSYILLPWELNYVISEKNRGLIKIFMIIGYLMFYFLIMHFSNGLI